MENYRYLKPATLEDALFSKSEYGSKANFLLGGTDFFKAMDKGVKCLMLLLILKALEN